MSTDIPHTASPETTPSASPPVQTDQGAANAAAQAYSALEAQVATLTVERDSALERAAGVDAMTQDRDAWKSQAESAASKYTADPEAFELVEYAYGRTPEEGRPELGEWLRSFQADPLTAPLALRSVFGQPTAVAVPRPIDTAPRSSPPGAPPDVTSDKIKAVRMRAQETGDWSEYGELRKLMGVVR